MMKRTVVSSIAALSALFFALSVPVYAQDSSSDGTGYKISPDDSAASDQANAPIRLARFSVVDGDVSWRPTANDDWATAGVNVPIQEGAQIWVANRGRAEIQFDDGSYVRFGDGAVATLQTLYSDSNSEFTEIDLSQGVATLDLRNQNSTYQLDTPLTSVKAVGDSVVRVGVATGVEVAVHSGSATLAGSVGSVNVDSGYYVYIPDAQTQHYLQPAPDADSWDAWNEQRDADLLDAQTTSYLPANIATCAGNLDQYGSWQEDPTYGRVWYPTISDPNWRPYEAGSWVYVQPFGWTWCSSEPWGWAPYHYGTWFHSDNGWAWCPGPARQYWSPAVVSFSSYDGNVGWCPLAPREVDYTSLSLSFGSRGFSLGFSISQAGCYYPDDSGRIVGRPFDNRGVNRYGHDHGGNQYINVTNITNITNVTNVHNVFVPENARSGGVLTVDQNNFDRGGYRPAVGDGADVFHRGTVFTAPAAGVHAFSGPPAVRPTASSWSPGRTVETGVQPSQEIINRPVVRQQLPEKIERVERPLSGSPVSRVENIVVPSQPTHGYNPDLSAAHPPVGTQFTPVQTAPLRTTPMQPTHGYNPGLSAAHPPVGTQFTPVQTAPTRTTPMQPTYGYNPGTSASHAPTWPHPTTPVQTAPVQSMPSRSFNPVGSTTYPRANTPSSSSNSQGGMVAPARQFQGGNYGGFTPSPPVDRPAPNVSLHAYNPWQSAAHQPGGSSAAPATSRFGQPIGQPSPSRPQSSTAAKSKSSTPDDKKNNNN